MPDFSSTHTIVTPTHIDSWGQFCGGWDSARLAGPGQPSALTWTTNVIAYIPITLPWPYPVFRVWWVNGSTVTTTNVDMGIYSFGGAQLYSTGSTVMGTASDVQYVALGTPLILGPGMYYLAWTCSNTTSRAWGNSGMNIVSARMAGILQETAAIPLPAAMTPVAWAQAGPPTCGITRTSTGF